MNDEKLKVGDIITSVRQQRDGDGMYILCEIIKDRKEGIFFSFKSKQSYPFSTKASMWRDCGWEII